MCRISRRLKNLTKNRLPRRARTKPLSRRSQIRRTPFPARIWEHPKSLRAPVPIQARPQLPAWQSSPKEAAKRRIQGNWLQNTIDPGIRASRTAHAVVEFTIAKDGGVKDVRISQASGNASMDNSGLRAIMSSNPLPALPPDYSGSSVRVIFDFDLSMTR